MKPKTFEELLEGKMELSLINQPCERREEAKESAREIARKRWRMIKRELRER